MSDVRSGFESISVSYLIGMLRTRGDDLSVDSADWLERLSARGAVPEGFVLVPARPTHAMREAAYKWHTTEYVSDPMGERNRFYGGIYSAMLAAAPQPAGDDEKEYEYLQSLADDPRLDGWAPEPHRVTKKSPEPAPSAPSSTSPRDSDEPAPVIVCAAVIVAAEQLATIAADYLRRAEDCSVVDAIDEGAGADGDEPSKALRQAITQMQRALAYPAPSAPSPGDALSLDGAAGRSASREPADVEACPLGSARWSARGGFLCYGTARIAQFDWESGYASADSLRARTQDWIARRLSGAKQAAKDGAS